MIVDTVTTLVLVMEQEDLMKVVITMEEYFLFQITELGFCFPEVFGYLLFFFSSGIIFPFSLLQELMEAQVRNKQHFHKSA